MKALILLNNVKSWDSLPNRLRSLKADLNEKLNPIYGDVKINHKYVKKEFHTKAGSMPYDEFKKLIEPYKEDYRVVHLVINRRDWVKSGGRAGLYGSYYRDRGDRVCDTFVICNEKEKRKLDNGDSVYVFENTTEHEIGHAISADLGLKQNGTRKSYFDNYDNTHHFFHDNNVNGHYQYLYAKANQLVDSNWQRIKRTVSLNTKGLYPEVYRRYQVLEGAAARLGMPIRITSGYRSFSKQDKLYAQGRTTTGNIVTNAKGGQSMHNYRIALDYCFKGNDPYPKDSKKWKTVNNMAELLGFYSYGNSLGWDYGHIQLMFGLSEKDVRNGKLDSRKYGV